MAQPRAEFRATDGDLGDVGAARALDEVGCEGEEEDEEDGGAGYDAGEGGGGERGGGADEVELVGWGCGWV